MKSTKKLISNYYLRILSRHPSVEPLRKCISTKKKKIVYRHGSTTFGDFEYEINSVDSVKISSDKLKMKQCFDKAEVSHAEWTILQPNISEFLKKIKFPENMIIIKHVNGSRGTGNYLISTQKELDEFIKNKSTTLNNYIVEKYKKYSVEYRLHVTENGCFYTCRKVLKNDTPKEKRFQRHDDNCSWLLESNPNFNKPKNWDDIVKDCVKALKMIGADVLAFDIKCTSIKDTKDGKCKWILIESCSAPSFADVTIQKYKEELPKIINKKYGV